MADKDEQIKDPTTWWESLKAAAYFIIRIPGMLFDKQRDK